MTRSFGLGNIEYAQADILELGATGRTFDVIEASGVLHHLAEPMQGWRALLAVLRPGGFMHVGLYSHAARRSIRSARAFVAEKAYRPTAHDIRRCREDIMSTPMKSLAGYSDFFSTSECRDLLFHVQEHHLTIPEISSFIGDHDLKFIGFELEPQTLESYGFRFPEDRSMTNLDYWHMFETEKPDTFASMYQFWIQKS
jgi:SAM-dependent methyltransferase